MPLLQPRAEDESRSIQYCPTRSLHPASNTPMARGLQFSADRGSTNGRLAFPSHRSWAVNGGGGQCYSHLPWVPCLPEANGTIPRSCGGKSGSAYTPGRKCPSPSRRRLFWPATDEGWRRANVDDVPKDNVVIKQKR